MRGHSLSIIGRQVLHSDWFANRWPLYLHNEWISIVYIMVIVPLTHLLLAEPRLSRTVLEYVFYLNLDLVLIIIIETNFIQLISFIIWPKYLFYLEGMN